MKIPDRTRSRKAFEDDPSYRFCFHCNKCAMTHDRQLYREGRFFCTYLDRWKDADDVIEKDCKGFSVKSCVECKLYRKCYAKKHGKPILYCNNWKKWEHQDLYLMGRIYRSSNESKYALLAEENFERLLESRLTIKNYRNLKFEPIVMLYGECPSTGEKAVWNTTSYKTLEESTGITRRTLPRYIALQKQIEARRGSCKNKWYVYVTLPKDSPYKVVKYETGLEVNKPRTRYMLIPKEI